MPASPVFVALDWASRDGLGVVVKARGRCTLCPWRGAVYTDSVAVNPARVGQVSGRGYADDRATIEDLARATLAGRWAGRDALAHAEHRHKTRAGRAQGH